MCYVSRCYANTFCTIQFLSCRFKNSVVFFLLFLFFIVVFVVKEITIFWFWRWQVECICFSFTNVCIDAFVISEL